MNKTIESLWERIRFRLNSVEHNGQRVETRSEKQGAVIVHTPVKPYKPKNGTLSAWIEKNPQTKQKVVPSQTKTNKTVQIQAAAPQARVVASKPRHSKGVKETMIDAPETDAEFIDALHALATQMEEQAETVNNFFETLISTGVASDVMAPLETLAETLIEASQATDEVVRLFMARYEHVMELAAAGELPGGNTFFTGEVG